MSATTAPPSASAAPAPALASAESGQCSPPSARSVVWRALWTSRLVIWLVGTSAVLNVGNSVNYGPLDPAGLTRPFGYFMNLLVSPFARWDSVWYLAIARFGYQGQADRTVYFPLYPYLMRGLGWIVGSPLIAGIVISLACFAVGLLVLHRLVALDFPREVADATVLLIAFFPTSFFFSAVYTESLFLALSLGCIYQARLGRWGWAGLLGALAAATRNSGVLLTVIVLLLMFYGPTADGERRRLRGDRSGWRVLVPKYGPTARCLPVMLIPLGLLAYLLYLNARYGLSSAPFNSEVDWFHKQTWPFGGAWQGLVAGWDGLRQILHGPPPPVFFAPDHANALWGAAKNVELIGFLVLAAVGVVGVLRTQPFAYALYVLIGLALPLSDPVVPEPLQSLPRYELVLFPLFIWAAQLVVRRRWLPWTIAVSAVLLGYFTAEFATWRFVA